MNCPYCGTKLVFLGDMAAPGFGAVLRCWECEKRFVEADNVLYDPEDYVQCEQREVPWIARPEDTL